MPTGVYARPSFEQRFWKKVNKTGPVPDHSPALGRCWLWTGAQSRRKTCNYGHIGSGASATLRAHRVSWQMHFGPIPDGENVLHRCDNGLCVNPDHLFLGSQADNIGDMDAKGRRRVLSGDEHPARRRGARRGERNGRARLQPDDIRRIRELRAAGALFREIAAQFGVAVPTIQHIISGKNWSHIA